MSDEVTSKDSHPLARDMIANIDLELKARGQ